MNGFEAREYTGALVDGEHTITEYLSLYRRGMVGPLKYQSYAVGAVCCRQCRYPRWDDGTCCDLCGAYQRCITDYPDAVLLGERQRLEQPCPPIAGSPSKPVNPRRRKTNGR
jgi:hypothetical protein